MENLRQNILPAHAWMIDESRILLQDFITDMHNYVGILRAVADGQQALGDISSRTGLNSNKASFYLSVLRDSGFVERRVPFSQRGTDSRRGRYFVTDPYLRFFYRFLSAYQSKLALGHLQEVLELVEEKLPEFIENNTWEELCRQWLLQAQSDSLPVSVQFIASEWARNYEIDVVGSDESGQHLILGDCLWRETPAGPEMIQALLDKTSSVVPREGDCSIYYTLFSGSGWTDEAHARADSLLADEGRRRPRRRWQVKGIRLLDLEMVDADLTRWAT
jgi:AAA+ ATPase superfamily predicted ATPase